MKIGPPYPPRDCQKPQNPTPSSCSDDEEPPPYTEWEPLVADLSRIASAGAQPSICDQETCPCPESSANDLSDTSKVQEMHMMPVFKEGSDFLTRIDEKVDQFILPIREKPKNDIHDLNAPLPAFPEHPINRNDLVNFSLPHSEDKGVERMASVICSDPLVVQMAHIDPLAAEFIIQEPEDVPNQPEIQLTSSSINLPSYMAVPEDTGTIQRSESFAPGDDNQFSSAPLNEKRESIENDTVSEGNANTQHDNSDGGDYCEVNTKEEVPPQDEVASHLPLPSDRQEEHHDSITKEEAVGLKAAAAYEGQTEKENTSEDSLKINSAQPRSSSSGVTTQLAASLNAEVFTPPLPSNIGALEHVNGPDIEHSHKYQPHLTTAPQPGHVNVNATRTDKILLNHYTDAHVSLTSTENPNAPIPSITDSCIGAGSLVVTVDCRGMKFPSEDRQDDEFYARFGGVYMVLQMFNDQWAFCTKMRMTTALCQYCYNRPQENKKFGAAGLKRIFRLGATKEVKKPDYRIMPETDARMGPLLGFLPLCAVTVLPNLEDYCAREKVLRRTSPLEMQVPPRSTSLPGESCYYNSDGVLLTEQVYKQCFEASGGRCYNPLSARKILKQLTSEPTRKTSRELIAESVPKLSNKRSIRNFFTGTFSRRGNGPKRAPLPQ